MRAPSTLWTPLLSRTATWKCLRMACLSSSIVQSFSPSALADKATKESVLLYNMGFAYHREGVERGCSALLAKALHVYETARRVLRKSSAAAAAAAAGGDLVMFALVNNMGHIHSHFFNQQAADGCRRCLSLSKSTYSRILSKCDLAFFCMNFFKTDMLQCAPAA
jgi:hypothetical protein